MERFSASLRKFQEQVGWGDWLGDAGGEALEAALSMKSTATTWSLIGWGGMFEYLQCSRTFEIIAQGKAFPNVTIKGLHKKNGMPLRSKHDQGSHLPQFSLSHICVFRESRPRHTETLYALLSKSKTNYMPKINLLVRKSVRTPVKECPPWPYWQP